MVFEVAGEAELPGRRLHRFAPEDGAEPTARLGRSREVGAHNSAGGWMYPFRQNVPILGKRLFLQPLRNNFPNNYLF